MDFKSAPIRKIFHKMFIPTLLGMVSEAMMCVIDGYFVSKGIGGKGVAAINFCAPMWTILAGVGLMLGLGASVIMSDHMAKGDLLQTNRNMSQNFLAGFLFGAALSVFMVWKRAEISAFLGASDELGGMSGDYLLGMAPALAFEITRISGSYFVRLDGSPKYAMSLNLAPAIFNIIFDWLLIIKFNMGTLGAGIASSMGILSGWIMLMAYLIWKSKSIVFVFRRPRLAAIREALVNLARHIKIGFGSFISEVCNTIFIIVGNLCFMKHLGAAGVGAFGLMCYYTPVLYMCAFAIINSIQPVISICNADGQRKRVRESLALALRYGLAFSAVFGAAFIFLPKPMVEFFLPMSDPCAKIALENFPLIGIGFPFFICNIIFVVYFQSIKKVTAATIFSFLKGIVFVIPAFILFPAIFGTRSLWLVLPVAELLTSICIGIYALITSRHGVAR